MSRWALFFSSQCHDGLSFSSAHDVTMGCLFLRLDGVTMGSVFNCLGDVTSMTFLVDPMIFSSKI
jgi:hypothetical protein